MKKLKIDRRYLEEVFGMGGYEMTAYLDTKTGEVILAEGDGFDHLDELLADEGAEDDEDIYDRFRMIPKQDSQEGYQDMQDYIRSVDDKHLQELLEVAIQGPGAFRRFKDVLYRYPEAQKNWFSFRDTRQQQRIMDWLKSEGIKPEFE